MPNKLWWTPERMEILRRVYPTGNVKLIMDHFPQKTWNAIKAHAASHGIHFTHRGNNVNQDFFKVWTPEMAYVLGYITADGCIIRSSDRKYPDTKSHFLKVSSIDGQLIGSVSHVIGWDGKISVRKAGTSGFPNSKVCYTLSIGSKEIYNDLVSLGITERKSLTIQPPNRIPNNVLSHYCRGFIDGDGTISARLEHRKRLAYLNVRAYSPCKEYIEWMNAIISSHCNVSPNAVSWNKTCWGIKWSAMPARKVCDWLYADETICLLRKKHYYLISDVNGRIPYELVI